MSKVSQQPRAIIHKKILEVAKDDPDASAEEIARRVSAANAMFVERVLEKYGDPARHDMASTGPTQADPSELDAPAGVPRQGGSPEQHGSIEHEPAGRGDQADLTGGGDSSERDDSANQDESPGQDRSSTGGETSGQDESIDREPQEDDDSAGLSGGDDPSEQDDTTGRDEASAQIESVEQGISGSDETEVTRDAMANGDQASVKELGTEVGDLTDVQRHTLHASYQRPGATQHEIADRLGVSASTVNRRVNAIGDFEWSDRQEFVAQLFEDEGETPNQPMSTPEREDTIEGAQCQEETTVLDDPKLVHKMMHACFQSDRITEEEEMRILRAILD